MISIISAVGNKPEDKIVCITWRVDDTRVNLTVCSFVIWTVDEGDKPREKIVCVSVIGGCRR